MLTHEFVTNVCNKIILEINKGVLPPVSYISNFIKKTYHLMNMSKYIKFLNVF